MSLHVRIDLEDAGPEAGGQRRRERALPDAGRTDKKEVHAYRRRSIGARRAR